MTTLIKVAQTNLSKHVERRILIRMKLRKCSLGQDCLLEGVE